MALNQIFIAGADFYNISFYKQSNKVPYIILLYLPTVDTFISYPTRYGFRKITFKGSKDSKFPVSKIFLFS